MHYIISGRNRAFDFFVGFGQWVSGSGQENSLASNSAPDTNRFLRFSRQKHSFQHIFLSKKDIPVPAVSAVTIIVSDNTKIFYPPMSTRRNLAKINDRRL